MKVNPSIDELLNGFLDEELTQRQLTELQRLLSHDTGVAQRLGELEKCKVLVGSLPSAQAPAGMMENIKTLLERRTPQAPPAVHLQEREETEREGARHLLARKVLSAAAMFVLAAVLAVVVYSILSSHGDGEKSPIALTKVEPVKVDIEKTETSVAAIATGETVLGPVAAKGFSGRLEVQTYALKETEVFIKKAIEDSGLEYSSTSQVGKTTYVISCSKKALGMLLAQLETGWAGFGSTRLFVETNQIDEQVVVTGVGAEQIVEIVNQDTAAKRFQVARGFAVLNKAIEVLPGEKVLTAANHKKPDLITIPKPVLTSSERNGEKLSAVTKDQMQVHLTIVVLGSK